MITCIGVQKAIVTINHNKKYHTTCSWTFSRFWNVMKNMRSEKKSHYLPPSQKSNFFSCFTLSCRSFSQINANEIFGDVPVFPFELILSILCVFIGIQGVTSLLQLSCRTITVLYGFKHITVTSKPGLKLLHL